MANETKRIKPAVLDADESAFAALQTMEGYAPANPSYSLAAVTAAHAAAQNAKALEAQAEAALASARDNSVASEWAFHNLMLGVKDQVTAQFGRSSNQVQSVGRKKDSEHKSPQRSAKKAGDK